MTPKEDEKLALVINVIEERTKSLIIEKLKRETTFTGTFALDGLLKKSGYTTYDSIEPEIKAQIMYKWGIKTKEKGIQCFAGWNKEYIEEFMNWEYPKILQKSILVLDHLKHFIRQSFSIIGPDGIKQRLNEKSIEFLNSANYRDAWIYRDANYRMEKSLDFLENHLEAFFWISWVSQYEDNWNHPNSHVIEDKDYPFIKRDKQQWIDFDIAFHLLPILEKAISILDGTYGIELKDNPNQEDHEVFRNNGIITVINEYLQFYSLLDENMQVKDKGPIGPHLKAFYTVFIENPLIFKNPRNQLNNYKEWATRTYGLESKRLSSGERYTRRAKAFIKEKHPELID